MIFFYFSYLPFDMICNKKNVFFLEGVHPFEPKIGAPENCNPWNTWNTAMSRLEKIVTKDSKYWVVRQNRRRARIKKLIKHKLTGAPKNTEVDTSAILGPHSDHFWFCRHCSIALGERVPLAPLGWYSIPMSSNIVVVEYISITKTKYICVIPEPCTSIKAIMTTPY